MVDREDPIGAQTRGGMTLLVYLLLIAKELGHRDPGSMIAIKGVLRLFDFLLC